MTEQEYEAVKALKDIAYELKRLNDTIDEERKAERGQEVDRKPPVAK